MMFAVGADSTPSIAKWVRVGNTRSEPSGGDSVPSAGGEGASLDVSAAGAWEFENSILGGTKHGLPLADLYALKREPEEVEGNLLMRLRGPGRRWTPGGRAPARGGRSPARHRGARRRRGDPARSRRTRRVLAELRRSDPGPKPGCALERCCTGDHSGAKPSGRPPSRRRSRAPSTSHHLGWVWRIPPRWGQESLPGQRHAHLQRMSSDGSWHDLQVASPRAFSEDRALELPASGQLRLILDQGLVLRRRTQCTSSRRRRPSTSSR